MIHVDVKVMVHVIDEYNALVKRAIDIVSGAPYFTFVHEPDWARVTIKGEVVTLHLCYADVAYESAVFETDEVTFPRELLLLNDAELVAWQAEQQLIYECKEKERQDRITCSTESKERATLAALKAKYEG